MDAFQQPVIVANDLSFDHRDHFFGHVCGQVADTLELARDKFELQQGHRVFGVQFNLLFDALPDSRLKAIHVHVTADDFFGQPDIFLGHRP